MKCIRCDKDLAEADADYVIAKDFIVKEKRHNFYAITGEGEGENYKESSIKIARPDEALLIPNVLRIEVKIEDEDIQKTGIVCPKCYKKTDFVIWGKHKK
jgi:hypothetical protein